MGAIGSGGWSGSGRVGAGRPTVGAHAPVDDLGLVNGEPVVGAGLRSTARRRSAFRAAAGLLKSGRPM
jgi:hypothetical protein